MDLLGKFTAVATPTLELVSECANLTQQRYAFEVRCQGHEITTDDRELEIARKAATYRIDHPTNVT